MLSGLVDRVRTQLSDPAERSRLVGEVLKFCVVGVGGVCIDIGLFNVFRHVGVGPLTSKGMSTTTAAVLSYFANRHWSFAHRARTGVKRELPLFIVLSAIGLGIAEGCLAFSYYGLHQHSTLAENVSANGFGLVLGTIWRFWSFKRWVFTAAVADEEVLVSAAT
ncbi:MAG TPA: GtrA family protein [Mycobacteriales bacterium]